VPGRGLDGCSSRMPVARTAQGSRCVSARDSVQPASVLPGVGVDELHILAFAVSGIDDVAVVKVAPEPAQHR
jgi:hypothetical protein